MAKKKKFYVVWQGMDTGVFDTWQECQRLIKGFPGAQYASFSNKAEADHAFNMGYDDYLEEKKSKSSSVEKITVIAPDLPPGSWAVDAACSGNPGKMEYQGVYIDDGGQIFHQGPFRYGTNNIGEFLALVHALALLYRNEDEKTTIYSDSRIAIGWVKKGKARTKLVKNLYTKELHHLIQRAENWLTKHTYKNPIIKWETKEWGEIPADFGRK